MVQVQPPAGWQPPTEADYGAADITENAGQQSATVATRRERDPNDSQATLSGDFGDIGSVLTGDAVADTLAKPANRRAIVSPPIQPTGQQAVLPNEKWTSPQVVRRRKAFAWVAGILSLCIVALTLIGFLFAKMFGNASDEVTNDRTQIASSSDREADSDDPGNEPKLDKDSPKNKPSPESSVPPVEPAEKKPNTAETDATTQTNEDEPVDDELDVATKKAEGNTNREPFEIEDNAGKKTAEMNLKPNDQDSIIGDLGEIGQMIFDPGISLDEFRDITADTAEKTYGIGRIFIAKPDPVAINTPARMDEVFAGVIYDKATLIKFVRFFNQLTSVPIQLDHQAVADGRIDPLLEINVNQADVPARELLLAALEPAGLTIDEQVDPPVIIVTPANADKIFRKEYPINGKLFSSDELRNAYFQLIQKSIDPPSWNVNGGGGVVEINSNKLVVDQIAGNQTKIDRFVKLLEAATTLKQSPDDREALETIASLYSRVKSTGKQPSTFEVIQSQPMSEILNQVQRNDAITVLVDWVSIMPEGWSPQTNIPWPSDGLDIDSVLADITSSMKLGFQPLDEHTYEITTREKIKNSTRLELYPCGKLLKKNLTGKQIIRILENGIAASLPKPPVFTYVFFEPEYECVIAILPYKLHIRAERILKRLAEGP